MTHALALLALALALVDCGKYGRPSRVGAGPARAAAPASAEACEEEAPPAPGAPAESRPPDLEPTEETP